MTDLANATCGRCIFFGRAEGQPHGSCWRYPPTSFPIVTQPPGQIATPGGATTVPQGVAVAPIRPPVAQDTPACGEFDDGSHGNLTD
jgi:hypothetical protein